MLRAKLTLESCDTVAEYVTADRVDEDVCLYCLNLNGDSVRNCTYREFFFFLMNVKKALYKMNK